MIPIRWALKCRWLFKRTVIRFLFGILKNPSLTPSQLVLVLNNAIAIRHERLFRRAATRARLMLGSLTDGSMGDEDHQAMRFVLSQEYPFDMIRMKTTDRGRVIVLNLLRSLRPARSAGTALSTIRIPFDEASFNFTKLQAERFGVVELLGHKVGLYMNKYPYGPCHIVAVPDVDNHLPQFLTYDLLALMWALGDVFRRILPDMVVGYNSVGARASIYQLHFQLIGLGTGRRNSGAPALHYSDLGSAWSALDRFQVSDQPLNALYDGTLRLVPRHFQGTEDYLGPVDCPEGNTGYACAEVDGLIPVVDPDIYASLTDSDIDAVYDRMCPEAFRVAA